MLLAALGWGMSGFWLHPRLVETSPHMDKAWLAVDRAPGDLVPRRSLSTESERLDEILTFVPQCWFSPEGD